MKTNGVPAIVMLTAGLIDCVISIQMHLTLYAFTKQLLLVLVLFYVIGCVVQVILDRNFKDMEDTKEAQDEEGNEEGEDGGETEAADAQKPAPETEESAEEAKDEE